MAEPRVVVKTTEETAKTSTEEMKENFAKTAEWKVIEGGGVLSVPVTELRLLNMPGPDRRTGKREFEKHQVRAKTNVIDYYSVDQTERRMNDELKAEYDRVKDSGMSDAAWKM